MALVTDCIAPNKLKKDAPQHMENMLTDKFEPKFFVAMIENGHRGTSSEWCLDSGATYHAANDNDLLTGLTVVTYMIDNCNGGDTDVTLAKTVELMLYSEYLFGAKAKQRFIAMNPTLANRDLCC